MADITAIQQQALSGMNLSDHEKKMKELEAELEAVKARIAETKANIANLKADQKLIESAQATTQDRQLEGERSEDGSLIPVAPDKGIIETVRDMTEDEQKLHDALMAGEELTDELQIIANNMSMKDFEDTGIPVVQRKVIQVEEDDIPVEEDDIETDERTDAESENRRFGGIDREEGRAESVESEARGEKAGWEMAEGSNTWSINEKDDYWKTQEGFDEAVALYGSKPAWVKEPTLVYNPETDEYEEIEEEEFEDLSRPAVSADIKKLFG
jgi:hypothetical protein